ncbi:nucleotidase, partial [Ascoidea rubescens DSM 1968]
LQMTKQQFTQVREEVQEIQELENKFLKSHQHPVPTLQCTFPIHSLKDFSNNASQKVFFFDIDNCLYSSKLQIHQMMQRAIQNYISQELNLSSDDAIGLNLKYYQEYGLAIQGLKTLHSIDALEYNRKVDDALPLHDIIKKDLVLRNILIKLKNKNVKLWLFTNAYKNHALKVISLLGIADLFDGLTYCDYAQENFLCKPYKMMFLKAINDSGVVNSQENAYFIDDSRLNCLKAKEYNFFKKVFHLIEDESEYNDCADNCILIKDIHDLTTVVPELF